MAADAETGSDLLFGFEHGGVTSLVSEAAQVHQIVPNCTSAVVELLAPSGLFSFMLLNYLRNYDLRIGRATQSPA